MAADLSHLLSVVKIKHKYEKTVKCSKLSFLSETCNSMQKFEKIGKNQILTIAWVLCTSKRWSKYTTIVKLHLPLSKLNKACEHNFVTEFCYFVNTIDCVSCPLFIRLSYSPSPHIGQFPPKSCNYKKCGFVKLTLDIKGAMKEGRGTCSTYKLFDLTYLHIHVHRYI